jgi:putative endonuclease
MYYVYMLKSKGIKSVTYVGYTNNLKKRLILHNTSKGAKFTRGRKWILIYKEKFKSKKEAISREYYIKNNRLLRNKIKNENLNTSSL